MNWQDCLNENSALHSSKDIKKAESLLKTAEGRIKYIQNQKITKENANYIFEGLYSSIIEILHAIVIKQGFKVNNHMCLGYYLRDILNRENLFRTFDDLRYKRNSLIYYGKEMDFDVAKDSIEKSRKLIKELKEIEQK
jgi:hypothetical protein